MTFAVTLPNVARVPGPLNEWPPSVDRKSTKSEGLGCFRLRTRVRGSGHSSRQRSHTRDPYRAMGMGHPSRTPRRASGRAVGAALRLRGCAALTFTLDPTRMHGEAPGAPAAGNRPGGAAQALHAAHNRANTVEMSLGFTSSSYRCPVRWGIERTAHLQWTRRVPGPSPFVDPAAPAG